MGQNQLPIGNWQWAKNKSDILYLEGHRVILIAFCQLLTGNCQLYPFSSFLFFFSFVFIPRLIGAGCVIPVKGPSRSGS